MEPLSLIADGSVSINVGWIVLGGFGVAFGTALYKLFPWMLKTGLEEVIERTITPKLDAVHKRIDDHMNAEEDSFGSIETSVAAVGVQLEDRVQLFDNLQSTMERTQDVLTQHLADDKQVQEAARIALIAGQSSLLERLDSIEKHVKELEDE